MRVNLRVGASGLATGSHGNARKTRLRGLDPGRRWATSPSGGCHRL